jgi:deazaflavin-dependent oxidoreductase (nitroreductase family)
MSQPEAHYQRPGWLTRKLLNPAVVGLTRAGVSIMGGRILEVRGRQSGQPRRTPVNLLVLEGHEYLVSPRGDTQWVRNVRADGGRLALLLGQKREERVAAELADSDKPPILRAYLRRWKAEVGVFFGGITADSPEDDILRIAPKHPVFVLSQANEPKIDPESADGG